MRCTAGADGVRAIRLISSTRAISGCAGSRASIRCCSQRCCSPSRSTASVCDFAACQPREAGRGAFMADAITALVTLVRSVDGRYRPVLVRVARLQSTKRGLKRAWENLCTRPTIVKVCVNNVEPCYRLKQPDYFSLDHFSKCHNGNTFTITKRQNPRIIRSSQAISQHTHFSVIFLSLAYADWLSAQRIDSADAS